ncbi:hypothetical protein [Winogradskyella sp.]|uniref:hypothetical protein n=1 Tax=Winogradskyella sp. TaxID=1883156 RepID=UPI002625C1C3|nr:hypothetical protein [Winogradskyella sp.]
MNQLDSYLCSPFYFLLTGRKGLKVINCNDSAIIFSDHPNLEDETIIFPPSSKKEVRILDFLFSSKRYLLKKNLRIIRCNNMSYGLISQSIMSKFNLQKKNEYLLDWKYPSVTISVRSVLKMSGKNYKDLRYNINKVDSSKVVFEEYKHQLHYEDSLKLINKWCKRNTSVLFNESNLSAPYLYLLNQIKMVEGLFGYVMYYKDNFVAFNILDKPYNNMYEFISLAFLADVDFKGIPSYMRYKVCEFAKSQLINTINIGGAETLGLYRFKKKLVPSRELELFSITNQ